MTRASARARMVGTAALLVTTLLCGCRDEEPAPSAAVLCDPGEIVAALAAAREGDVVRVGECRIEVALEVPAGVRLEGLGPGRSVLAPPPESRVGVRVVAGGELAPSAVSGLSIESSGLVALLARDGAAVALSELDLRLTRGVGVVVDGLEAASISRVRVSGPITRENAESTALVDVRSRAELVEGELCDLPPVAECAEGERRTATCDRGECGVLEQACVCGRWRTLTATHGIVLLGVGTASLDDVEVRGTAVVAVTVDTRSTRGAERPTRLSWTSGGCADVLGSGLVMRGEVEASLAALRLERSYVGMRGLDTYALVLTGPPPDGAAPRARLEAVDLVVADNEHYGIAIHAASAELSGLTVEGNGHAGVWVSASESVVVADSSIARSAFAGLWVVGSRLVTVRDSAITDTRLARRPVEFYGSVSIGDGLLAASSADALRLERVRFAGNERTGITVDLAGTDGRGLAFDEVQVEATGSALGAVAGEVTTTLVARAPGTWNDVGIERLGAAAANDLAAAGSELQFAGASVALGAGIPAAIVSPCD